MQSGFIITDCQIAMTIEGPRNFLVVSDNYIDLTHTGGRVYTHHGGISTEKIQIYRNVILNVDRSFVWVG